MAIEVAAQRLEIGDVVLMDLSEEERPVEATVVRDIDRTDTTVRVTFRVGGRESFVREWPLGEMVTVRAGVREKQDAAALRSVGQGAPVAASSVGPGFEMGRSSVPARHRARPVTRSAPRALRVPQCASGSR